MSSSTMPVDLEDLASGYSHRPPSAAALARAAHAADAAGLGVGDVALDIGVAEERITTKMQPRLSGIARDILAEASEAKVLAA